MSGKPLLESALAYALRGWPVFPCDIEKKPRTSNGFKDATTDARQINAWWERWPDANIGIATGAVSGLYVVDEDDGGAATIEALALPQTYTVVTPSRGRHFYFAVPADGPWRNTAKKLGPGVDTRGDGGYVVAPPSRTAKGVYRVSDEATLAPLPDSVIARLRRQDGGRRQALAPVSPHGADERSPLRREADRVAAAPSGRRNETLNEAAFVIGQLITSGEVEESEARAKLRAAALRAGLEDEETEKTLESGLRAGMANPRPPSTWEDKLKATRGGERKGTPYNMDMAIRNAPELVGLFSYDQLKAQCVVTKPPPWFDQKARYPRDVVDDDIWRLSVFLESRYAIASTGKDNLWACVRAVGGETAFNPVCDYLDGLRWDGKPRLNDWPELALGADSTRFVQTVGRKFLIGAVARALEPGCKMDTILVLEGRQGTGKSDAVRLLSKGWLRGNLPDLRNEKEAILTLQGAWLVELSELDAIRKSEATRVKAFLSRQEDSNRVPWGRACETFPRRCVFVATTNEDHYLIDDTGNRRFWPIHCRKTNKEWLSTNADQLWAEAVEAYRQGEAWYLTDEEELAAIGEQDARQQADPWEELLGKRLGGDTEASVASCFGILGVDARNQTRLDQNRIGRILRRLGFTVRKQRREGIVRVRVFERPRDGSSVTTTTGGGESVTETVTTKTSESAHTCAAVTSVTLTSEKSSKGQRQLLGYADISEETFKSGGDNGDNGDTRRPPPKSYSTLPALEDDPWP